MFAHCQHGGHEPEVVISHHLRNLVGPRKHAFARDKPDGMCANSVRQLATYHTDY